MATTDKTPDAVTVEVDALAKAHGLALRLEHDETAPLPWAVWCWDPAADLNDPSDADIIGAGESASEAIEGARAQLRAWEATVPR